MKCPACAHENVSDFPFCEECLTLLPARPGNELAFELDVETETQKEQVAGWPPSLGIRRTSNIDLSVAKSPSPLSLRLGKM